MGVPGFIANEAGGVVCSGRWVGTAEAAARRRRRTRGPTIFPFWFVQDGVEERPTERRKTLLRLCVTRQMHEAKASKKSERR